jgi:hypothetical protein
MSPAISSKGNHMASDSDWVQDVRRWYFGGEPPSGFANANSSAAPEADAADSVLGYEAAHPALQASWPESGADISAR